MNDDLHTLVGAYAVHALPYAEWVLFEEHLFACPGCGAEVRRLRETVARLAETVAEPPPAALRERLLSAAYRSRTPDDGPTVPLRRRRSKVMAGLAAVCAAAAVALGVIAVDARRDLADLTARNDEMIAVLAAPDAETVRRPVASGGTGTVVISRSKGRMVFASSGLAELPDAQGYELWLMGPDGPRPAGMLERADDGLTRPVLLSPRERDDHVAVTVEPARGSREPTTRPVLLAELPRV
ncbi:anti-sigma factor domain-containing protein [Nonomuraea purpurea]|uniref:Regulator of SigK n=1 Tax=Nonomuraea purpurea TaxID=1849276 RepID=A0ABV8G479_9ACTN